MDSADIYQQFQNDRIAKQDKDRQKEIFRRRFSRAALIFEHKPAVDRKVHACADNPCGDIGQKQAARRKQEQTVRRIVCEKPKQGRSGKLQNLFINPRRVPQRVKMGGGIVVKLDGLDFLFPDLDVISGTVKQSVHFVFIPLSGYGEQRRRH